MTIMFQELDSLAGFIVFLKRKIELKEVHQGK